jgi:hypothetical protein
MIKKLIRKVFRALAQAPLIGRPVRMAAALYRIAALAERTGRLNGELQNANSVTASPETDRDNLLASLPVTLRKLRRDVDALQARLAQLEKHQG